MEEKKVILGIYQHPEGGIEIEISTEKDSMNVISLIGLLEQIKFDLLSQVHIKKEQ